TSWNPMINYLVSLGYPREFLFAIQLETVLPVTNRFDAEHTIPPAVDSFLDDVNAFLAAQGYTGPPKTKVDIVSHSMGSVSSRWYAGHVAPERVHAWISLAGSNHGTNDLCPYVRPQPDGASDMCPAFRTEPPDSIQVLLNGQPFVPDVDETPYGIGPDSPGVSVVAPDASRRIVYWTVRTSLDDEWISPDESVILDGTGGIPVTIPEDLPATDTTPAGNFQMTNNVRHMLLQDPQTMRLVAILLQASANM
ncbi:MAG: hypothetical protein D6815_06765, partial [Candidatus Dadabacteria bacterium]